MADICHKIPSQRFRFVKFPFRQFQCIRKLSDLHRSFPDKHSLIIACCHLLCAFIQMSERTCKILCMAGLPFILETPNDDAGYAQEIAWLRAAQK